MRCYYHREVEAVATCKSCGRGLCPDCANEVGAGLACRGRCEDEGRALNRIIERNKTAYEKAKGAYLRTALFYGTLGLVFLGGAVADWRGLMVAFGAGMLVTIFGLLQIREIRRRRQQS